MKVEMTKEVYESLGGSCNENLKVTENTTYVGFWVKDSHNVYCQITRDDSSSKVIHYINSHGVFGTMDYWYMEENGIVPLKDKPKNTENFEYPIFKKAKNLREVVRFESMHKGTTVIAGLNHDISITLNCWTKHTNQEKWEDVPYDRKRDLFHGQLVHVWNNNHTHYIAMTFYDAINKCTFKLDGRLDGPTYSNYEAVKPEHIPEWAIKAYNSLEGI